MIFNPGIVPLSAGGGGTIFGTPTANETSLIVNTGVELGAVIISSEAGEYQFTIIRGMTHADSRYPVTWSDTAVTVQLGSISPIYKWVFIAFPKT